MFTCLDGIFLGFRGNKWSIDHSEALTMITEDEEPTATEIAVELDEDLIGCAVD